jgi:hypothetical protein
VKIGLIGRIGCRVSIISVKAVYSDMDAFYVDVVASSYGGQ